MGHCGSDPRGAEEWGAGGGPIQVRSLSPLMTPSDYRSIFLPIEKNTLKLKEKSRMSFSSAEILKTEYNA